MMSRRPVQGSWSSLSRSGRRIIRRALGGDLAERDIRWLDCGAGARVLEVGVASGFYTLPLARSLRSRATLIALDLPGPRLAGVCAAAAAAGAPLSGVYADCRSLPFASASLDAILFAYSLEVIPAPEQALAEAARVLRPGGQLVLFLWRPLLKGRRRDLLACAERTFRLERSAEGLQNVRYSFRRNVEP